MFRSEVNTKYLTKNHILYRASLRGLKKCSSCSYINGQRALICRNVNCALHLKKLSTIKPFDPIQLITFDNTKLYSLRSKEKLLQPRNFVSISEYFEHTGSQLLAVCYVDSCKCNVFEPAHSDCRHIKACKVLKIFPQAEVYPIDKGILWSLNISPERKQLIWDIHQLEKQTLTTVQKIHSSIFVVKCLPSKVFPAGRLHVTVVGNKISKKSGTFSCSCTKQKLILEPDNSVIMKQEICDHLLLLLAAILNKPGGKALYGKFLDSLQHLWMPTSLNTLNADSNRQHSQITQFTDYDLSLEKYNYKSKVKIGNVKSTNNSDDIFNFAEEAFVQNNIGDFSNIILEASDVNRFPKIIQQEKLMTSTNDEEKELNFQYINSAEHLKPSSFAITQTPNDNILSDIEELEINHNIDAAKNNIEFIKDEERVHNMEPTFAMEANLTVPVSVSKQESLLKTSTKTTNIEQLVTKSCLIKNPALKIIQVTTPIQKQPMDLKGQTNEISTNSYVKLITNNCKDAQTSVISPKNIKNTYTNTIRMPTLSYESWLDYIIEILNESIAIQISPTIKSTFHVPEHIFNHFSKTFNLEAKTKLPHKTSIIKSGKYEGHIKYTWYLNQASSVQRIFNSTNMKIELERFYQRLADGSYELFNPPTFKLRDCKGFRTIYPKVQLYKVFMQFADNAELCANNLQSHKFGLKLEWLPSAFPKSKFGLMAIQFSISVKEPIGTV